MAVCDSDRSRLAEPKREKKQGFRSFFLSFWLCALHDSTSSPKMFSFLLTCIYVIANTFLMISSVMIFFSVIYKSNYFK
ncbi:MAG: hypothetical protein EAZ31_08880 [Cytophagia bacterium]|nr:MAG: hypothetical protein EAZ31_08880 [Cytophagia bacterium]